jgi:hypothetical protein
MCDGQDFKKQVAEKKPEGALEEYVLARQRPRRRSALYNGTWNHH